MEMHLTCCVCDLDASIFIDKSYYQRPPACQYRSRIEDTESVNFAPYPKHIHRSKADP